MPSGLPGTKPVVGTAFLGFAEELMRERELVAA